MKYSRRNFPSLSERTYSILYSDKILRQDSHRDRNDQMCVFITERLILSYGIFWTSFCLFRMEEGMRMDLYMKSSVSTFTKGFKNRLVIKEI